MSSPRYLFVLDVESVGLYGQAFAYGCIVVDVNDWSIREERLVVTDPVLSRPGGLDDIHWVVNTIPRMVATHDTRQEMFADFVELWDFWRGEEQAEDEKNEIWVVADCPYPVEAHFFDELRRVTDPPIQVYPLLDVASMLFLIGKDPIGTYKRMQTELPRHNPLMDARMTVRQLKDCCMMVDINFKASVEVKGV